MTDATYRDDPDQGVVQALVDRRPYGDVTAADMAASRQKQQSRPRSPFDYTQFVRPELQLTTPPKPEQYGLAPNQQRGTPFDAFKDPMLVLAGLSSLFTRHPLMGAMNYAAGAMKGYNQGQTQVFEENKQKFDEALKAATEQNRVELARYNNIWDRKQDFNWAKVAPQLEAEAARNHDEIMLAALHSGNWALVEKILVGRETSDLKFNNTMAVMNARAEVERNLQPTLTEEAALQYAQRENAGDHSWKIGMGRGIQGKADIDFVMNMAARLATQAGKTGADIAEAGAQYTGEKSYQRTAGSYAARVESAVNEATGLVPQALEASRALPRGTWVPFNELYQKWQQGTSDPKYNDFMAANIALLNTYMRAMNPQGVPRITERLEAHSIGLLSTATSQEAYETQVRRLWTEMQINKEATAKTRQGVGAPEPFPENKPKEGDRKQFKQGWGVFKAGQWVPENAQ